ncbi:hypothetical protein CKJ65_25545 [Mycobacterium intracellulare]|nr:hypothetical protein CKJ65_25545 [Mycobacterium intracellulare]
MRRSSPPTGDPNRRRGKRLLAAVIDSIRRGVPAGLEEVAHLGRTLWRRRHDILAFFDHHASNGPTEAINGRLEALRRDALGFRNRSCPESGRNREHGRRFRFTTCKSVKKEKLRPCLFEYQPPAVSAPRSMPCLPRIGSCWRSLKKSPPGRAAVDGGGAGG